ncbi:MAG: hypothetical protein P8185_21815 [Deltaproteobacteria bacterium]
MGNKYFLSFLCPVMLLLAACVSDPQLQDQNALLNKELKHVRFELYQAHEKIERLDAQLKNFIDENNLEGVFHFHNFNILGGNFIFQASG